MLRHEDRPREAGNLEHVWCVVQQGDGMVVCVFGAGGICASACVHRCHTLVHWQCMAVRSASWGGAATAFSQLLPSQPLTLSSLLGAGECWAQLLQTSKPFLV